MSDTSGASPASKILAMLRYFSYCTFTCALWALWAIDKYLQFVFIFTDCCLKGSGKWIQLILLSCLCYALPVSPRLIVDTMLLLVCETYSNLAVVIDIGNDIASIIKTGDPSR
jgi:hypothetical protein